MNRLKARKALARAVEVMDSLEARYWIDCGTLLGCVREGGLLAHDGDVDLSCWDWQRHAEIRAAMEAAGFECFRTFGTPEHGYEQRFRLNGIKLDVFYFYPGTIYYGKLVEDRSKCWQGSWKGDHLIVSEFPLDIVSASERRDVEGLSVPVPLNPERMLEARYGDWRTPNPHWHWATDPLCITPESRLGYGHPTFLVKSFMRPQCVLRCVRSIRDTYGAPVMVVDDSDQPPEFANEVSSLGAQLITLPFDTGLSAGRNAGVRAIDTEHTVVIDDDIVVSDRTDIARLVSLLDVADVACGTMHQDGRRVGWEGHYEFLERGLRLRKRRSNEYDDYRGTRYASVDFGLNIFAARTEFLKAHRWDDALKVVEHTDYFLRLKQSGARVVHTPDCIFDHNPTRTREYHGYRYRKEFRKAFSRKHGLDYLIGANGSRVDYRKL